MRPKFISLEGSEACGKSTQITLLHEILEKAGQSVLLTREPGGTPLGESIRHLLKHSAEGIGMVPEAEILLFTASRAQLARKVIAPALEAGQWVLSDRYGDSTTVYQGVARRLSAAAVAQINDFAMGSIRPGLTLVLDLEPDEAGRRLRERPRPKGQVDRMEQEPLEFYRRVREGYQQLAQADPDRIHLVPAGGTVAEVQARIWKQVVDAFSL